MSIRRDDRGVGNGDICPVNPEHGRMYVLPSGTEYCSHNDHDAHGERPATPSLHRQQPIGRKP
jgi:hypothetical protein